MDSATQPLTALYSRLAPWTLGLLALALWVLQHPFYGIAHDSVLYTLFALVRLHPATVGWDVVVRHGSQDRFTVFSPIYTAAIRLLGLEHAAAVLLLLSMAALLTCAWVLARRFMSRLDATLGLLLLVTLPSDYGARGVFHYLEDFLTPRMPAEALVLGALIAALRQRYWIAGGCVVAAMLLHPIMGATGAAFLILTWVIPLRPKVTLPAAAVGVGLVLVMVVAIAPLGRLSDPDWMGAMVAENDYLFVTLWSSVDWSRAAVPLALLAIGSRAGATPLLRRMCAGALGMAACGLAITLLFVDWLHVWLFISLQAWRWLWLADLLGLILAPAIIQDCWRRGHSGQAALVILAVAWVFRGLTADYLAIGIAVAIAVAPVGQGAGRHWRLLFLGACALLAMSISITLIDRLTYISLDYLKQDTLLQEVRAVCGDGVLPVALSILLWIVLRRPTWSTQSALLPLAPTLVAAALCIWVIPYGWKSYAQVYYTPARASLFEAWRARIPAHAEVLWPDSSIAPWYLLERPSYWSPQQVAGGLFSREQALVMERRTADIRAALKNSNLMPDVGESKELKMERRLPLPGNVSHIDLKALNALCVDPDLQYVVSQVPLTHTSFPRITLDPSRSNGTFYLFQCADLRSRP